MKQLNEIYVVNDIPLWNNVNPNYSPNVNNTPTRKKGKRMAIWIVRGFAVLLLAFTMECDASKPRDIYLPSMD